jgi:tetratricopeptide (TPR) repeat protein
MRAFIIILLLFSISSFSQNVKLYDSLFSSYKFSELFEIALERAKSDSTDITSLTYLARAAEKQYLENIALDAWLKVVDIDKENYEGLSGCKRLFLNRDQFQAALPYIHRMNRLNPGLLRNYWDLAWCNYKLEKFEDAHRWCDSSLLTFQPNSMVSDLKAHIYLAQVDTVSALRIWYDLTKNQYADQYARQLTFNAAGKEWHDTVINLLTELSEQDSLNAYLPKMQGYLLFRNKDYADATIMFRKSMELGDSTEFVRRFWGMSAFNFGDYSSAFRLLGSLKDINENNSLFYMMSFAHARVYADTTSAELLLQTYKKFFDPPFVAGILNESSEVSKTIGDKYERRGLNDMARDYYQKCESQLFLSRKIHFANVNNLRLAMLYDIYKKDYKKALKYYNKYLENNVDTSTQNYKFTITRLRTVKEILHFNAD